MKHTMNKLNTTFSSFFRNRLNVFYVSAFAPLVLIMCLNVEWPFAVVIPIYGFIFLLLKKSNLVSYQEANHIETLFGLIIMFLSFFVYYVLAPFFPGASFYGSINYAVYFFGLVLTFFGISALREAFTPMFLMVAATSSSSISNWLEPHLTPYIPHFVSLIAVILRTLGVGVTGVVRAHQNVVVLHTVKGSMVFVWACVGVASMLIFSIILVVTLFEESTSLKTKLVWAVIGLTGTFIVNIVRVTIIFFADYFYGFEVGVGGKVHYFIGYVLFITWLIVFFYTFSKRQAISKKFQSIWQKLRSVTSRQYVSP